MSKNYRIVHTGVGNWRHGDVVSAKHIEDAKALSGLDRLKRIGAVEETDDDVNIGGLGPQPASHTKGDNVDPGSDDTVEKRAARRAEAVGEHNSGMPGDVTADLSSLKKDELVDRATAAGIDPSGKTKAELVEELASKTVPGTPSSA